MNKHITKEILEQHFQYFTFSLFRYSGNYLHLIFKKDVEIPNHVAYVCPLCAKNYLVGFEKELLSSTDFTLDHFPPASVGGNLTILTCKKCNNDAGRLYEAELLKKMKYEASGKGNSESVIDTKFRVAGLKGNYASFIKRNINGAIILDFPKKAKSKTPFLNAWLENEGRGDDWEVKLEIPRPDNQKILKAALKTAYLICFVNWGYDFIFSSNGKLLREVLNDKVEYPLQYPLFWFDESKLPKDIQLPLGLCVVEKPNALHTFVVNVPLQLNEYSAIACIPIPYSTESGWEKLKEIHNHQITTPTVEVTFKKVGAPLSDNILDGYTKTLTEFNFKQFFS